MAKPTPTTPTLDQPARDQPDGITRDLNYANALKTVPFDSIPAGAQLTPVQIFEIERMGRQGLQLAHIADRLGIPRDAFKAALESNPLISEAYRRGAAEGLDKVSNVAYEAAASGRDLATTRWWLERKGGFTPPPSAPVNVQVNAGPAVTVSLDNIDSLARRQSQLLDGVIDGEVIEPEPGKEKPA